MREFGWSESAYKSLWFKPLLIVQHEIAYAIRVLRRCGDVVEILWRRPMPRNLRGCVGAVRAVKVPGLIIALMHQKGELWVGTAALSLG